MTEDELRHIEAVLAGVEGYTQRDLFEQGKQLVSEVHCLRAENAALKAHLKAQAQRDAEIIETMLEIYPDLANAVTLEAALAAREAE